MSNLFTYLAFIPALYFGWLLVRYSHRSRKIDRNRMVQDRREYRFCEIERKNKEQEIKSQFEYAADKSRVICNFQNKN